MRKRTTESPSSVYSDTTYRRTVPSAAGGWYSGDYQAAFRSSHDYQDSSYDSLNYQDRSYENPTTSEREATRRPQRYRDIGFSDTDWSQRRRSEKPLKEDQYQYYQHEPERYSR